MSNVFVTTVFVPRTHISELEAFYTGLGISSDNVLKSEFESGYFLDFTADEEVGQTASCQLVYNLGKFATAHGIELDIEQSISDI